MALILDRTAPLDMGSRVMEDDEPPAVELTIVMPCLNEAATIATCVRNAWAFLDQSGIVGEIIVADNGSVDGSQDQARALGARVIQVPMRGYGSALFAATTAARGRYCIMGDSDASYDFRNLQAFVDKLRDGFDLVMGDRFAGGIQPGAMPWKNRYIGNPVLSGLGRFLFASPIRDFHCGLRGFSKDAFGQMDLRTTGMEYASEMVIKATLLGMKIAEVPTTLSADGRDRKPHLRPFRDGWRHLRFMLLFSPAWLFFYPGVVLCALGLLVGGILLTGPIEVLRLGFSLGTLIYCSTAICIGAQAILFSILSRSYAVQEGLIPRSSRGRFFLESITLERGLAVGFGVLAIGLGAAFRGVALWRSAGYGELDVQSIARIVITSSLFLSLGFEIVLCSFLLSTLRLNTRSYPGPAKA